MPDDNQYLTKHERLAREFDGLVLANKLRPEVAPDLVAIFGPRCIVNDKDVLLDGLDLKSAAEKIVADRPYAQPADAVSPEASAVSALVEQARHGNVTAWSRLAKNHPAAFADLKARGLKPGDLWTGNGKIETPDKNKSRSHHASNPFAALRDANGKIDPAAAARVASVITGLGATKAAALAKAAGVTLDGRPLGRAA